MPSLPQPSLVATQRRGRAPKFTGIVAALRGEILGGRLTEGDRLPSWDEIAVRFDTTKVTVKKAIDVLAEDGLLEARLGSGTYVAAAERSRLPVVLVLAGRNVPGRSRFFEALAKETKRLQREGRNLVVIESGTAGLDTPGIRTASQLALEHRLAGVVFALDTYQFEGSPLIEEPHIPRVRIGSGGADKMPGVGFGGDGSAIYEKVFEHFASRGRRRVALIRNAQYEGEVASDPFPQFAARFGLETHPWWVQGVSAFQVPDNAERIAQLLAQGDGDHRPDALFISDDNLVPYATLGLKAVGASDMDVVAHANFPWPTESHVPVRRIGFDVGQILELALESVEAQRQGKPLPSRDIPPRWEEEVGGQRK